MGRPYSKAMLLALADYQVQQGSGYRWTAKEIAERYGLHPTHLSRAATKLGVGRLPRRGKSGSVGQPEEP